MFNGLRTSLRRLYGSEPLHGYTDFLLEPIDYAARLANGKRRLPPLRIRRHFRRPPTSATTSTTQAEKRTAETYRFPFDDGLRPDHRKVGLYAPAAARSQNYVRQTGRLLAPTGHALLTFFLLGPERDEMIAGGRSITFPYGQADWRFHDADVPERASAFSAGYVLSLLDEARLELARPVLHGYQDVLLIRPEPASEHPGGASC